MSSTVLHSILGGLFFFAGLAVVSVSELQGFGINTGRWKGLLAHGVAIFCFFGAGKAAFSWFRTSADTPQSLILLLVLTIMPNIASRISKSILKRH